MSPVTHAALVEAGEGWISERLAQRGGTAGPISGDTDLFQAGVLDSLGLVDLITFLEERSGGAIDMLSLDEAQMAALNGLCRAALAAE